jgi:transcriptional regulator with XRE-family HTH domain
MLTPRVLSSLEALGGQIRLARKRRRMTQAELAARSGISDRTLRSLETGEPAITLGSLAAVLDIFGLEQQLADVARNDPKGEALAEVQLGRRIRPKKKLDTDF